MRLAVQGRFVSVVDEPGRGCSVVCRCRRGAEPALPRCFQAHVVFGKGRAPRGWHGARAGAAASVCTGVRALCSGGACSLRYRQRGRNASQGGGCAPQPELSRAGAGLTNVGDPGCSLPTRLGTSALLPAEQAVPGPLIGAAAAQQTQAQPATTRTRAQPPGTRPSVSPQPPERPARPAVPGLCRSSRGSDGATAGRPPPCPGVTAMPGCWRLAARHRLAEGSHPPR